MDLGETTKALTRYPKYALIARKEQYIYFIKGFKTTFHSTTYCENEIAKVITEMRRRTIED